LASGKDCSGIQVDELNGAVSLLEGLQGNFWGRFRYYNSKWSPCFYPSLAPFLHFDENLDLYRSREWQKKPSPKSRKRRVMVGIRHVETASVVSSLNSSRAYVKELLGRGDVRSRSRHLVVGVIYHLTSNQALSDILYLYSCPG
jgi:hypothetical protein